VRCSGRIVDCLEQWIKSSYFDCQVLNLDMSRLDISQRGRCGDGGLRQQRTCEHQDSQSASAIPLQHRKERLLHVITEHQQCVSDLPSSHWRLQHVVRLSGAINISIPRQPMLFSHCSTRFLARRSPARSSSSFPRNVWSACTRLVNASCYSLADTLLDRQCEILKRHRQPH
jgi:hypothetical protein